jgi:hypothetical protein
LASVWLVKLVTGDSRRPAAPRPTMRVASLAFMVILLGISEFEHFLRYARMREATRA